MVKKKRRGYDIEAAVLKWKLERIAHKRQSVLGKSKTVHISVERNDPAADPPRQCFSHIACAGGHVEYERIRNSRQESFDGANSAEPAIDDFQFPVGGGEFVFRPAQIVHDLAFAGAPREIKHGRGQVPSSSNRSRCNWPGRSALAPREAPLLRNPNRIPNRVHQDAHSRSYTRCDSDTGEGRSGNPAKTEPAWSCLNIFDAATDFLLCLRISVCDI
jgi:hypothetical protein